MNIKQILPFFSLLLVGCLSPTPTSTDTLVSIDIEKALDNPSDILLSDFSIDSIEYIPLETTSESLITSNGGSKTIITDQYIIAFALRNTLLFERKTGKFIRVIAHAGPGHNDYVHSAVNTAFDEQKQTITRGSVSGGIEYDLEGNVIRKIRFFNNKESRSVNGGGLMPLGEQGFAMYIHNITGNEPVKFFMYDKEGSVTNIFQNHHSYEDIPGRVLFFKTVDSYKWKDGVYFYEEGVDTLYRMTTDTLIPYMHFRLGKYNPLYSERGTLYDPWENPRIDKYISLEFT